LAIFDEKIEIRERCCGPLIGLSFSCFLLFSGLFWPGPFFPIFRLWIPKRCKGVHCVDLGESFPTSIYLQKSASIQPRTSPSKFGGKYSILENYLDEYFEAKLLNSNRIKIIENSIFELIEKDFSEITLKNKNNQIEEIDSFLCKIKESKIRTGLHIFGNRQNDINEINLFLCIARVPNTNQIGVTQYIAKHLKLDLNP